MYKERRSCHTKTFGPVVYRFEEMAYITHTHTEGERERERERARERDRDTLRVYKRLKFSLRLEKNFDARPVGRVLIHGSYG